MHFTYPCGEVECNNTNHITARYYPKNNTYPSLVSDNMHDGRLQRDLRRYGQPLRELPAVLREAGDLYCASDICTNIRNRRCGQWYTSCRVCQTQSYEKRA